ncbi:MAG: M1 family peptidase [Burkholderiales bacterium]|nr:M1 family peptidase [Burkholderiales bacterium]
MMRRRSFAAPFVCGMLPSALLAGPVQGAGARVLHQALHLEPDLTRRSLHGRLRLQLAVPQGEPAPLRLDAGALQIDAVRQGDVAVAHERVGGALHLQLTPGPEPREIEIDYHGAPTRGITFLPEARQIHTAFATSEWMPCIDAPDVRASLALALLLPAGLQTVGNGELLRAEPRPGGKTLSVWSLAQPMPSYLYGFAAGPFRELIDDTDAPVLRYLVPQDMSDGEVRAIFGDTRDMIAFYTQKAGLPFPARHYTQVLVGSPAAQEMAGFSVLGEAWARRVLAGTASTWLVAHELSHQWWGNGVTNRAWTEFWLNEGVASFMNAAYFEHRDGPAGYRRFIEPAQHSLERIRAAGGDKPLVFADWARPSADDRALVYDKGVVVMHRLREHLGESAFWRGLREYTRRGWGLAVGSHDLQSAMQSASGRDLQAFFTQWVYRSAP